MPEQLDWPVVEIPKEDPEVQHSENYFKAKAIIEDGIAASIANESPLYMVKVWQKKTHLHDAKEIDISLSQYLAGSHLSSTVSSEEYLDLLNEYNPINEAYQELHAEEIAELYKVQAEATEQKVGSVATKSFKPVQRIISGQKMYFDSQSAAAGDNTLFSDKNDE